MNREEIPEKVVGILLCAGGGTRFSGPSHKLTAILRGRPVIDWSIAAASASEIATLVVVTGAIRLAEATASAGSVIEIHNPHWAQGQATSLQVGLKAALDLGAEAVVVGLGDQPFVSAQSWTAVARSTAAIAVATYAGVRGNPVRLHRSVWDLLPTDGDHGARSLISRRPDLVDEVACSGSAADIDTMEDLHQWNSSTNSP